MRVTPREDHPAASGRRVTIRIAVGAPALRAQTLQQAEALWKARQYQEANDGLPRPGGQESRRIPITAFAGAACSWSMRRRRTSRRPATSSTKLWRSRRTTRGALLGLALIAADNYGGNAANLAQKALEADPKLVEAQELLARLALEDNNNAKATEEAHKALALDPRTRSQARPFWPPSTGWPTRKTPPGIRTPPRATRPPATSSCSTAATRKAIEYLPQGPGARSRSATARARSLAINLMRLGRNDEAYQQLKTAWDNHFQDSATKNTLTLMDSYKQVRYLQDRPHHSEVGQEGSRSAASVLRGRDGALHRHLRKEVQVQAGTSGARGSLSRPRRFRRPHARHARARRAGCDLRLRRSPWTVHPAARRGSSIGPPPCGTK